MQELLTAARLLACNELPLQALFALHSRPACHWMRQRFLGADRCTVGGALAYYAANAAGVDPREYSRQYEAKLRQAEVASIQVHAKRRQAGGGGGLTWPLRLGINWVSIGLMPLLRMSTSLAFMSMA